MKERRPRWPLVALCCAFIAAGVVFARHLGIETDEAMIANGIYDHGDPWYSWKFGGSEIPVMLISYLGALKTWIYNPYFLLWKPGAVSLRLPTIIAGAATLWIFFALLDSFAGRLAAWIGTLLLATDSVFLLMETTDFGFVALQCLLKLSAILLLLRFHRRGSPWALAAAFFLFGLAMWDKVVFAWVLFGLAAGAIVAFPRELWSHLTKRNLAIASASLIFGALPLAIYNIARPLETLRMNAKLTPETAFRKAGILFQTLDGYALFGFMTASDAGPRPGAPHRMLQWLSLRLSDWTGAPHRNLILPALALSVLIALFARRARKPVLFAVVTCAATWLAMAFTQGAGATVQHAILLWPFHLLAIAVALAQIPSRAATAVTALLCISNVALTNHYYADLIRNGPAIRWTDAVDPLEKYLAASYSATPGVERIFVMDWGFFETLNLLSEGELPVYNGDVSDTGMLDRIVSGPKHLFVAHTPEYAYQPEMRARLEERARADGFQEESVALISDRNGRPTFEVFRFRKDLIQSSALQSRP
ncbi:MAG TPA: glycosyltransferase family 39 protein [Bryobacteraceae bacterium]